MGSEEYSYKAYALDIYASYIFYEQTQPNPHSAPETNGETQQYDLQLCVLLESVVYDV